jgi:hypothetical protein
MTIGRAAFAFFFAALAALGGAQAQPPAAHIATPSERYALAAPLSRFGIEPAGVDRALELAADIGAPKSRPLRYAVSREIHNATFSRNAQSGGEWNDLPDGMALWRLPVHAAGALTLDFGFRKMFLPPGAQLFVSNANRQLGPWSDADNSRSGEFWTPLLYGDDALIEVLLPQRMKQWLEIDLRTVHVGFRDVFAPSSRAKSFFDPGEGSGSCNLDTICPQGDPWRSEINAEAILVYNGGFCSGQLLADTRNDHTPYLSTANHCIDKQSDATSLIVYWKYESPVCRAPFSNDSALPVPTDAAIAQTGGSTLVATYQPADFTLLLLNTTPPPSAHVYFNGWDRGESTFDGAAVMHHPQADSKRISFAAGTVTIDDRDPDVTSAPGLHHWRVDHYSIGTTEEGSSGSGLLDGNHLLRGVLSGGAALCTDLQGDDYYGRLSTAWEGGGTPDTRVRDWLDPAASGAQTQQGSSAEATPSVALALSANTLLVNQQVTFTATVSGGTPPYTYAFDVDGDGVADNLDANAASMIASYPNAFAGNVTVTVADHAGHSGTASRALIVQAANLQYQQTSGTSAGSDNGDPVTVLCGNADAVADPGERFDAAVHLQNLGSATSSGGYAVFAQDISTANASKIVLETPAVAVPTLVPGDSAVVHMTFSIPPEAACGARIVINYLGTADNNGFTSNPHKVADLNAAPVTQCHTATTCSIAVNNIIPKRGNFFDPHRAGSGITQLTALVPGIDPVFFGAWFTGDAAHNPTWYLVNDGLHANQVNTTLFQTHLSAPNQFPETGINVGNAQISVISETKFVYTWVLNGKAGGGIYVPLVNDSQNTLRSWFNTNESGWGTFDELFPSVGVEGHPFMFNLAFLYDNAGTPRWTTGSDGSYVDGHVLSETVARPSCPACAWLDYTIGAQAVGPLSYQFSGATPSITTNLVFPNAYPGTWLRTALPLVPLVQ